LNKPIAAYRGDEPFVFVCYAHLDAESVYSDLVEMDSNGVKIWYDEGIQAGSAWRGEIAAAIKGAKYLLFFISESSLKSTHCLREVDYALSYDIEIIPVYLEECVLPAELELALNRVQALFRHTDSKYLEHLVGVLKEDKGLASILSVKKKNRSRFGLPVFLIAVGVLAFLIWQQWGAPRDPEPIQSSIVATPNAYDGYLEALELMKRWDKTGNLDSAIELYSESTKLDPSFALAYARLAGALRLRYVITRDESWLDQATENANEAVRLNPDLAPVQVALGRIQITRGNIDLASAALKRALSIDPNDAEANQAIAIVYDRQGRLQDAEASFQKAAWLDPESLLIRDSYANFLFRQSRFEDAAAHWRAVIRVAPDHFSALVNLGTALSETGKMAEAITMYTRAIEIRPTYMAYSNLGTAYGRAERYPEAVEALKKALEINDSDWLAWGNLAYAYSWMSGADSQARETFERAIQLAEAAKKQDPRDSYAHSDLALYYAKTGHPEAALQSLQTAIALSPDSGEILAAAAEVYELIGQRDKAIEQVKKSIELGYPRQRFQRNPELTELLADTKLQSLP